MAATHLEEEKEEKEIQLKESESYDYFIEFAKSLDVQFKEFNGRTFNELTAEEKSTSKEVQEHLQKLKRAEEEILWKGFDIASDSTVPQSKKGKLIGFCGYGGSGKDSCGSVFIEKLKFKRASFAQAIREVAFLLDTYLSSVDKTYNQVVAEVGYEKAKTEVPGFREHLIRIGEGARTHFYPNVWIDSVNLDPPEQPFVITDVRYPNDARRIQDLGGIIVYIDRPGLLPASDVEAKSIAEIDPDYTLINDGSLSQLLEKVETQLFPVIFKALHKK